MVSILTARSSLVQGIAGLHLANQLIGSEMNQPAVGERYLSELTLLSVISLLGIYSQSRAQAGRDGQNETKFQDHFLCKIVSHRVRTANKF